MSAFDIAGAVVWTPMTALAFLALVSPGTNGPGKLLCLITLISFGLAAAFCWARLNGAIL